MTEQEELAWAAGLYEGEGGVYSIAPRGGNRVSHSISMRMTQQHPEVLERFARIIGGLLVGPKPWGYQGKNRWDWRLSGEEKSYQALARLWPYLGEVKKAQAMLCIPALSDLEMTPVVQ